MRLNLESGSALQTQKLGQALGGIFQPGDVIALVGELGAGKTELVKGIALGLGVDKRLPVASPTYILLREYPGRLWLYHFDFYRLKSEIELSGIGYEEYFEGEGVCAVEWADKFPMIFGKSVLWVKLEIVDESSRKIEVWTESGEKWERRLEEAVKNIGR
jgi:tRNA threonylcarbamoyladenosine biosynthesis protein TsaE